MRKIDKHFSISPDLDNKIKMSLKKSRRSYSDELNFIINEYFKEKEELESRICFNKIRKSDVYDFFDDHHQNVFLVE